MSTHKTKIDRLWAKIGLGSAYGDGFHPLPYHLLDVANASRELWDTFVPAAIRTGWAEALRTDESTAGDLVSFWVGLHDIGKATPSFQKQGRGAEDALKAIGFDFRHPPREPHGTLTSVWFLSKECLPRFRCEESRLQMALALGGHHGRFPAESVIADLVGPGLGGPAWTAARHDLIKQLADMFGIDLATDVTMPWTAKTMPLVVHLAGLVTSWSPTTSSVVAFATVPPTLHPASAAMSAASRRGIASVPVKTTISPKRGPSGFPSRTCRSEWPDADGVIGCRTRTSHSATDRPDALIACNMISPAARASSSAS